MREHKVKLFGICTLWCSSPYQLLVNVALGYHADCGGIAHGICCDKNDIPNALLLSDSLPCIDHLDVPAMSFGEERAGQGEEGGFSIRLIKHGHV